MSFRRPKQNAQGEAQGDPIIEGGDNANVEGLPHSGMLEQVSSPDSPPLTPPSRRVVFHSSKHSSTRPWTVHRSSV